MQRGSDSQICFGQPRPIMCEKLSKNNFGKIIKSIGRILANEKKVIVTWNDIKIDLTTADVFLIASQKMYKNETFKVSLEETQTSLDNIDIDVEMHGKTTLDQLKVLAEDSTHILSHATQYGASLCVRGDCAYFGGCSYDFCNTPANFIQIANSAGIITPYLFILTTVCIFMSFLNQP